MAEISFSNLDFLDQQYQKFQQDPQSLEPSWRYFFEGWDFANSFSSPEESQDLRIFHLIEAYRIYGHLKADINPLVQRPTDVKELTLTELGFQESELDETFPTCHFLPQSQASLREIIEALETTYCGPIGIEYMGLGNKELEMWIQKMIEPHFSSPLQAEDKMEIFNDLNKAELFETFLHTKYVGQKRFSLEGGETFIPMISFILEEAGKEGVDEVVLGMAHRGRLNVLANILNKSYESIFHEFEDHYEPAMEEGTGDVKYHKGFVGSLPTKQGKQIHVTLSANPSHLESVDPVVEGQARAKQEIKGRDTTLPILVHGDSSVSGQGVVYETLQLCKLNGYQTGGTIHIVINNQIGFTTLPKDSRSTRYCTDIALAFGAPVLHVNAERPEACVYAAILALKIRQKFKCDVFLDLNCYRKYGHNEGDEPAFTQPLEYQIIRAKPTIRMLYRDQLVQQQVIDLKTAEMLDQKFRSELQAALEKVAPTQATKEAAPEADPFEPINTTVSWNLLTELTQDFCRVPEGFQLSPKIQKVLEDRQKMAKGEIPVDWGMAEHLAFASLLFDGTHVRISGQDSRRGTFSHRHAVWVDQQKPDSRYYPLAHLQMKKASFDVYNSPLSEYAVLGFDFGYSLFYPNALVVWEAQFGDFANGAQIIIDQYIASAHQKWGHRCSITLFLPHGNEGQGPEHSSARIERFLQLSADNNWQIANCTTPAQFFHLLRGQPKRKDRRPLVVFTPKALLRHPQCNSPVASLTQGQFEEFLLDPAENPRLVLLCSGKIYYDLTAAKKQNDVVIIRIEQLYPFHRDKFENLVQKYKSAKVWRWVQEEHANGGAWSYIRPLLEEVYGKAVQYAGRGHSASTAAGSHALHKKQFDQLMKDAYQ